MTGYSVNAAPTPRARRTVAVFVAHGMGQQIPFQTMDAVATGLHARARTAKPTTRSMKVGDEWLSRIEMSLDEGVDAHVYEAYWAPLTEGRIGLRDVMAFLAGAGRNALRNASYGRFDRWMFGELTSYPVAMRTMFYLLVTLAVIGALVIMNSIIVAVAAGTAILGSVPEWLTPGLLADLTTTFNAVVASLAAAGVALFGGMMMHRKVKLAGGWRVPRAVRVVWAAVTSLLLIAAIFTVILGGIAIPVLLHTHIRGALGPADELWKRVFPGDGVAAFNADAAKILLWFAAAVVVLLLVIWLGRVIFGLVKDLTARSGALGSLVVAALFAGLVALAVIMLVAMHDAVVTLPARTATPVQTGLVWALLIAASAYVREVLVQYLGDVAIYVMPYKLDAFNDVRREIKKLACRIATAVYSMKEGGAFTYDAVIVVGHSLGSVVAYDTLNQLIREDLDANASLRVVERTRLFLTFGSPLDKTAFIFGLQGRGTSEAREALAASVQPMITSYDNRPREWVNVYAPWDIISGHLAFYDDPAAKTDKRVRNVVDPDATTPVVAHTEYWSNPLVYDTIFAAACSDSKVPAPVAGGQYQPTPSAFAVREPVSPSARRPFDS